MSFKVLRQESGRFISVPAARRQDAEEARCAAQHEVEGQSSVRVGPWPAEPCGQAHAPLSPRGFESWSPEVTSSSTCPVRSPAL